MIERSSQSLDGIFGNTYFLATLSASFAERNVLLSSSRSLSAHPEAMPALALTNFDCADLPLEFIWIPNVVGIQESNRLAARFGDSCYCELRSKPRFAWNT